MLYDWLRGEFDGSDHLLFERSALFFVAFLLIDCLFVLFELAHFFKFFLFFFEELLFSVEGK